MLICFQVVLSFVARSEIPQGKNGSWVKFLAKVQKEYDLILIDCAPTDSILTDAAYFASRFLLVPVKPRIYGCDRIATVGQFP